MFEYLNHQSCKENDNKVVFDLTDDQKIAVMEEFSSSLREDGDPVFIGKILSTVTRPIRRLVERNSIAERFSIVHEVAQGEVPYYDVQQERRVFGCFDNSIGKLLKIKYTDPDPNDELRYIPIRINIIERIPVRKHHDRLKMCSFFEEDINSTARSLAKKVDEKFLSLLEFTSEFGFGKQTISSSLSLKEMERLSKNVPQFQCVLINPKHLEIISSSSIAYYASFNVPENKIYFCSNPDRFSIIAKFINPTWELAKNVIDSEKNHSLVLFENIAFTTIDQFGVLVADIVDK